MVTLTWLLSRMLFMRFVAILLGVSIFFLTLDIATYAEEILATRGNDLWAIAHYGALRLPATLSSFFGISILLASLLMLSDVASHSELVAIWSAGVSQFRIVGMLLPLAVLLGIAHFLIDDRGVPWAAPTLHQWGIGDYREKKLELGASDPIWMHSGNDILRAVKANAEASELEDVIIFRRSPDGVLAEQIMAEEARLVDGRWELEGVAIYYRENAPPSRVERLIYSGLMRPTSVGSRSGDPEEMSIGELSHFIANAGFGIRPVHVYETWVNKRFTLLLTGVLMILISVPLAARFQRGSGLGILFAAGVGLGFTFFIFDGISLTMGELGLLPPWLAAWLPTMMFTSIAGVIAFHHDTL